MNTRTLSEVLIIVLVKQNLRGIKEMDVIRAIKTELGEIHKRDAIFLDDIQFNYQKNEVTLRALSLVCKLR